MSLLQKIELNISSYFTYNNNINLYYLNIVTMPSKRNSKNNRSKTSKDYNKKKIYDDNDNDEFQNSEDEYELQSGGETESDVDVGVASDTSTIDIDPDDEKDYVEEEDDKYDPVNENEEIEDPDEETDIDEMGEKEEEKEEIEEIEEMEAPVEAEEGEYVQEAKPCHLKNLNKDFIVLDEDDSNIYGKMESKKINDEDRESDPIMTYYEMVRVIGTRAQQFNFGAQPLVKGLESMHSAKMAYLELISKMTPFIIRRHLPGKKYEDWKIEELEIIHSITDSFFVPENFDWNSLMKQADELNKLSENSRIISKSSGSKKSSSKKSSSKKSSSKKSSSKKSGSKKN
ncbi:MAG: DNA-directed RNA polymerase subunit 6 [Satyrvirus sp.]|uniref:DNA-directed RNA polymerase subunit 6 n=1 Tax=Satyrvirus sp. TaxID=2487771 RepID=A0A3G5AH25_9VIRU|nr:MAG: DNA-directed RNA polymerase subunit 6 [Satyrvirus sp.]